MKKQGEEWVGRVGEGLEVDDDITPMSSMLDPHSGCELSAEDFPFLLDTPEMMQSGEYTGSIAVFLSNTKQLFTLTNEVSVCSTTGCHGAVEHIFTTLVGFAGWKLRCILTASAVIGGMLHTQL